MRRVEETAVARGCHDLLSRDEFHAPALAAVQRLLDAAAQNDPDWRFGCSSKVLLAIPDFPDLLLIFVLRAMQESGKGGVVVALCDNRSVAQLVGSQFGMCAVPTFPAVGKHALLRAGRSALRASFARRPRARANVLLFTLGEAAPTAGGDPYFGSLADAIRTRTPAVTVFLASGRRLFFERSAHAFPLESFLNPAHAGLALLAATRDAKKATQPESDRDQGLLAFLRSREAASGELFQQRLMTLAFEGMIGSVRPQTIVYPFENRSWEKQLLRAARRGGVKRCIAYQHSSLTPRHWALHAGAGLGPADLPDQVLACGEITAEWVRRGMPQLAAKIKVAAALRSRRLNLPPPDHAGVLVAISSSRAEAWELLRLTRSASQRLDIPFIIRSHPTIPVDDLFNQLSWPSNVKLSRGLSLAEDLARSSLVAYSSSTVALEGMLYGRLPIFVNIGDVPSGDPLDGEHPFLLRAAGGNEFTKAVQRTLAMPAELTLAIKEQARAYAECYLREPTPERIDAMAEDIAQC